MQKQQKLLKPEIDFEQLNVVLNHNMVSLWNDGKIKIPLIEINDNIVKSLAFARRCGNLRVGLEQIQTMLQTEETGLIAMNKSLEKMNKKNTELFSNISRLILFSNDGAERFYRHSETILTRYSHRLLGVKLNASATMLGNIFYGKDDKDVKALLVNKKDVVLRVLSSFL